MNKKIKCVLIFHDKYGLGHIPFISYLCKNLPDNYELNILLGSEMFVDKFDGAIIHKIPKKILFSTKDIWRINYINEFLEKNNPSIFFVDYFPFGRFDRLFDIISIESFIHKRGGKVISLMRDIYLGGVILDSVKYNKFIKKITSSKNKTVFQFVQNETRYIFGLMKYLNINEIFFIQMYLDYTLRFNVIDAIIVFGDKKIFDIRSEFILSEDLKDKFFNIGYLPFEGNMNILETETKVQTKRKIIVSSGGSIISISNFWSLIKFLTKKSDYDIHIYLGPYVDEYIFSSLEAMLCSSKHINLNKFSNNFDSYLHDSDYFFCYGGYGTFQHLFKYSGKAFVMTNYNLEDFKNSYYEQKYRTKIFENILNVNYLDDFSEENLENCLNEYTKQKPNISGVLFCDQRRFRNTVEYIYSSI